MQESSSQQGCIPLDTALWLDELLSRIFAILENLEAPETRSESAGSKSGAGGLPGMSESSGGSFLMDKQSMFR